MQIAILSLGEVKSKHILAGEAEYLKRLKSFARVEVREISTRRLNGYPEAERKKAEAALLKENLKPDSRLILLDEKGDGYTSGKFASFLEKHMLQGEKRLVFAIGGVHGWDSDLRKNAKSLLSLSPLTFTFELTRLVLVEQIYRAITILKGLPYHKE